MAQTGGETSPLWAVPEPQPSRGRARARLAGGRSAPSLLRCDLIRRPASGSDRLTTNTWNSGIQKGSVADGEPGPALVSEQRWLVGSATANDRQLCCGQVAQWVHAPWGIKATRSFATTRVPTRELIETTDLAVAQDKQLERVDLGISAKQPQAAVLRDWYPYYAGFTEKFVGALLDSYLGESRSIIDVWNGSGTTTAVCAKKGIDSVGVDINPALTIIARARLTPRSIASDLPGIGASLINEAVSDEPCLDDYDPLLSWIRPSAVSRLRSIEQAIRKTFDDDRSPIDPKGGLLTAPESLSMASTFYMAVLFAALRDLLKRFRSSNPTWQGLPLTPARRIAPTWNTLKTVFIDRVHYFADRLGTESRFPPDVWKTGGFTRATGRGFECLKSIRTGNAMRLPDASASFDGCITSPPYATRIDYIRSTLPELALLGGSTEEIERLRRYTIGTPVVSQTPDLKGDLLSQTATELLSQVEVHRSKGSRTYYYPWMDRYFRSLQAGLWEIDRVVKLGGMICIVVQNSYYKEILVDLQQIAIEMLEVRGRTMIHRDDHAVSHNMSQLNPHARRHLNNRRNIESVLVFS